MCFPSVKSRFAVLLSDRSGPNRLALSEIFKKYCRNLSQDTQETLVNSAIRTDAWARPSGSLSQFGNYMLPGTQIDLPNQVLTSSSCRAGGLAPLAVRS